MYTETRRSQAARRNIRRALWHHRCSNCKPRSARVPHHGWRHVQRASALRTPGSRWRFSKSSCQLAQFAMDMCSHLAQFSMDMCCVAEFSDILQMRSSFSPPGSTGMPCAQMRCAGCDVTSQGMHDCMYVCICPYVYLRMCACLLYACGHVCVCMCL